MYENEDKMKSDILEKGNKDKNSEMEKMKNVKNKQVIHFHSLKKYRFYRFCKRGDSGDFIRFTCLCQSHKRLIMKTHIVAVLAHKLRFFCLSNHLCLQQLGVQ